MSGLKITVVCLLLSSTLGLNQGSPTTPRETSSPSTSQTKEQGQTGQAEEGRTLAKVGELRIPGLPQSQGDGQNDTQDDDQLVTEVLSKYGYFRQGKLLHLQEDSRDAGRRRRAERDVSDKNGPLAEAIRRFQGFFGLPVTGVADRRTITLMKKGRCGVADLPEEEEPQKPHHVLGNSQSPSDYSLLSSKWEKDTLTWRLDSPSNKLRESDQRKTMQDAFAMWSQVAPLRFEQRRTLGPVDIQIKFGRRHHGDDYPFDGKGKVLAHAFGPGETAISGDMHLDNDEEWTVDLNQGTSNLFLVATHELGHSLGLAHSRDPSALMYPYYGLTDTLGQDDIKAIQALYGIRIGEPPVTPRPRRRRPSTPATTTTSTKPRTRFQWAKSATYAGKSPDTGCDVKFDVVFQDDARQSDVYTGIQNDLVFRFNKRGLLDGYPATLKSLYPGAPRNADAVFGLPDQSTTYFIKGNKVWRFQGSVPDPAYPKALNPAHFRETIRFVLPVVDATGVQRIFVFGRTLWLEYNFDTLPSYTPHAHVIPQYWPDVATDVIYAVTGYDGNIYFISPKSHVILDSFRRAIHGGKRQGHPHWLRPVCHMADIGSGSTSLQSFGSTFCLALCAAIVLVLSKR